MRNIKLGLSHKKSLAYKAAPEFSIKFDSMKNIIKTVVGAIGNPTKQETKEKKPLVSLDLSPINLDEIKKSVARAVNIRMGIKDGGSVSIASGRVLYPAQQEERRLKILNTDMHI